MTYSSDLIISDYWEVIIACAKVVETASETHPFHHTEADPEQHD